MSELALPQPKTYISKTYLYRIYPNKTQVAAIESQLAFACDLYNAALQQRRDAWKLGHRVSFYDQQRDLTELRASGMCPKNMTCHTQRDPLRRLHRSFESFFRRCKNGEKPGYPRFRSKSRYDSLTFEFGSGIRLTPTARLRIKGVGEIKVRWHRPLPVDVDIRTITVKRSCGRWYAFFSVKLEAPESLAAAGESVGIDVGLTTFATFSNGEKRDGPKAYAKTKKDLCKAQRRVSRRKKGSKRRRKAVQILARKHEKARNVRKDHAHKLSHEVVQRFDLIAVEDLNIKGMIPGRYAKNIADQGWGQFLQFLAYKAEWAGREFVRVDPKNTSQLCSGCDALVPKELWQRVHDCPECGLVLDRDVNAARNILKRAVGQIVQAPTWEEGISVRSLRSRRVTVLSPQLLAQLDLNSFVCDII